MPICIEIQLLSTPVGHGCLLLESTVVESDFEGKVVNYHWLAPCQQKL